MVKGLKIEDELEIANSDKSENESEVVDSIEQFDSEESNHLKVKRTKGQRKSTMTQRSRRVEKHRRHNSEGAKMSWLCLLASALNSSQFNSVQLVLMPSSSLILNICVPCMIIKTWGTFYLNEFVVNALK